MLKAVLHLTIVATPTHCTQVDEVNGLRVTLACALLEWSGNSDGNYRCRAYNRKLSGGDNPERCEACKSAEEC